MFLNGVPGGVFQLQPQPQPQCARPQCARPFLCTPAMCAPILQIVSIYQRNLSSNDPVPGCSLLAQRRGRRYSTRRPSTHELCQAVEAAPTALDRHRLTPSSDRCFVWREINGPAFQSVFQPLTKLPCVSRTAPSSHLTSPARPLLLRGRPYLMSPNTRDHSSVYTQRPSGVNGESPEALIRTDLYPPLLQTCNST